VNSPDTDADVSRAAAPAALSLATAFCYWLLAVAFQAALTYWVFASGGGHRALWMPVSWLLSGAWLSRTVLRRLVEWHPVYNTLETVSNIKLRLLITWPITYPGLYLRILIDRYL